MKQQNYVMCRECGEKHFTDEVEVVNIEETMEGQDNLHYVCPETKNVSQSLVYRK